MIVAIDGPAGAGKSTLARRLAQRLGAQLVQTDHVRKQLFAEPRYTSSEHSAVYGWCHSLLRTLLRTGRRAVFDATNLEERSRRRVYDLADGCGARLLIVWTACPPPEVQRRMLRRRDERDEDDLSDAHWDTYLELRRRAEPIQRPHVVVNTSTDLDAAVQRLVQAATCQEAGPAL